VENKEIKLDPKPEPKHNKKLNEIKRELFKINKDFLEEFKNYQIIKLNILKAEDDFKSISNSSLQLKKSLLSKSINRHNESNKNPLFESIASIPSHELTAVERGILEEEQENLK